VTGTQLREGSAAAPAGGYRITDHEFGLLRELVQRETGIQLNETKRALLAGRLARRLRELRLDSFGEYYRRVTAPDGQAERVRMVDLITTNETRFFREPRQFELLEQTLIPAWSAEAAAGRRPRSLRVWSAACSSGEEPFSVAMSLLYRLPGWKIDVLATDLSTRILEQARMAVWRIEKASEIPEAYLKAFMLRGVGTNQGTMKASAELRRLVRFARLNLHQERLPVDGLFDLILCRNVLIYFSTEGRAQVVARLIRHLDPRGYLLLGHAETLNGLGDRLTPTGPSIYCWNRARTAARERGRERQVR
jgi:chemotaxis protein methyltransferase CheR